MNCQTCQLELEDFLYGELDAKTRTAVSEHLSVCADCRAVQSALEHENELFAQYYEQNTLEPSDEMWQAIHARIQPETASSSGWTEKFQSWFAPVFAPALLRQAGFAALLILLSVGLTALYFSSRKDEGKQIATTTPTPSPTATTPTPEPQKQAPPQPTPAPQENAPAQLATRKPSAPKPESKATPSPKLSEDEALLLQIAKATREYQGAIRLLERTLASRKSALDEGTIKQFEGSLALIDASISSSREALRTHPNDPTAARFLLAAYSRKVELMQEIAMR